MGKYEILDHTADIRLKIFGHDYDDFFYQAFHGFLDLSDMKIAKVLGDDEIIRLDISAPDTEELLVKFINELIRLIQECQKAPLNLRIVSSSSVNLHCNIVVNIIDEYPENFVEMKSATYSMLKIEEKNGVLSTPLIIDI